MPALLNAWIKAIFRIRCHAESLYPVQKWKLEALLAGNIHVQKDWAMIQSVGFVIGRPVLDAKSEWEAAENNSATETKQYVVHEAHTVIILQSN